MNLNIVKLVCEIAVVILGAVFLGVAIYALWGTRVMSWHSPAATKKKNKTLHELAEEADKRTLEIMKTWK